MNNAPHISQDDLAIFALGFLPDDEAAIATEHLEGCDECREELARLQGDVVAYALTAEMHTPPAKARERLMRRVAKEPKFVSPAKSAEAVAAASATPGRDRENDLLGAYRDRPARPPAIGWAGWMGWAAAIAVAAALGWEHTQIDAAHGREQQARAEIKESNARYARAQQVLDALNDPQAMQVALHLPAPGGIPRPEGHAVYNPGNGRLVFLASHLDPVPDAKTYQLWLLPTSGEAPVPAGLFRPDSSGNASVILPELPKGLVAKGFGVTIEPEGGSKAPTPPIVLAGM